MFASLFCALSLLCTTEGPLVGQPCPRLEFVSAIQGEDVAFEPRERAIRIFGLFQLGCEASAYHQLPFLKRVAEKYAKEPRVHVAGIATEWPAAHHAGLSRDPEVRAVLATHRAYFPVMRDRSSTVVQAFALQDKPGTPRTVVIDHAGVVRWHGALDSAEAAAAAEQAIADCLARFWVEPIADLPPELAAFSKGDFAAAIGTARKLAADAKATPELKAKAEQVTQAIEASARKLLEDAKKLRAEGYPGFARAALEDASKVFTLVPASTEAGKLLAEWLADRNFRREASGEVQLTLTLKLLERPKDSREMLQQRLAKQLATFGDTPIAPRIRAAQQLVD